MTKIALIHGPNLNLLGQRNPAVYGDLTLEKLEAAVAKRGAELGAEIQAFQSNHEGELIEAVHAARGRCDAIIINPGAFTHSSWALHDALAAYDGIVVEVHLSNPDAREPWRRTSVVAPVATGSISGFGGVGYELAVRAVAAKLQ